MGLYTLTKTPGATGYGSELYTFLTFLNDCAITADSVTDLTQKTLINPVFTGAITGSYTLGGTPIITSPTINNGVLSGTFTGNQTFSGTTTLTSPVLNGTVTGDAVSTTGGNNKLVKTDSSGNIVLTGGLTATGTLKTNGKFNLGTTSILTINASGEITITKSYHQVATEGAIASDPLLTILGGSEGDLLLIRPSITGQTVVATDNTGNLRLNNDFSMSDAGDSLLLFYTGTVWIEISRTSI